MSNKSEGFMEDPGHDEIDQVMICCDECDWEMTGTDEDELAGQYQTHMKSEHGKSMSMAQCREQVEEAGSFEDQPLS